MSRLIVFWAILALPWLALAWVEVPSTCTAEERQTVRNEAFDLASDYLNALGPDRTLTAFEAARAVRALKEPEEQR